jgi:hypothetical protein
VVLRAQARGERLLVEIEDECGGFRRAHAFCFNPSAIAVAPIVPVLASASRSLEKPCGRTEVTF